MEIARKYPDKKYVPDYSNQLKAIELAKTKEATIKKFLIIGSILFVLLGLDSILCFQFDSTCENQY